ncbi:hypothetical protein HanXRQr2_Chr03g0108781 [Helianthus annuus]|uniref:Uncharacterized protein n=1 Tax=Helianthus annuus TaxID=4232 RepID=A0A251V997_HELAN|nr:hypothetical protein HanXRQr2_Chr03g0108781 [Helianthus annuus]KAJ0592893.1 hypothetical protein HanHA300_Chr03g0090961 [Helianthus annuus]KAJ0607895.1 hypothetical protein HanHA89_Chr03g0102591 [Helianthus annuus]KAJ0767960.1 hypothetical protein HanLR1_Chr03g0095971 [Helianthus annuus]KAJ0773731.1 hypothetical protein HanOQP8_Chr03g0103661 [Helianthus annuus]
MQPRLPSELFGTRRSIRNSREIGERIGESSRRRKVRSSPHRRSRRNDRSDNRFARTLGFFSQSLLVRLLQEIATQPMMRKSRFEEMNRMA